MCICFFQVNPPGSAYPLVFCGNRDEIFSRESLGLHEWPECPGVFGGKDKQAGGTWLGVRPGSAFRFAVVHNVRQAGERDPAKASRGNIPWDFLSGPWTAREYAEKVAAEGEGFMGFNLVVADADTGVFFASNTSGGARRLEPGVYGLSNATIDTPWPKLVYGKEKFRGVLQDAGSNEDESRLMLDLHQRVLSDNTLFPHPLPGALEPHYEVLLSGVFVDPFKWDDLGLYGTRMQTICLIRADGSVRIQEYSIDTESKVKHWRGQWSLIEVDSRANHAKL